MNDSKLIIHHVFFVMARRQIRRAQGPRTQTYLAAAPAFPSLLIIRSVTNTGAPFFLSFPYIDVHGVSREACFCAASPLLPSTKKKVAVSYLAKSRHMTSSPNLHNRPCNCNASYVGLDNVKGGK